VAAREREVGHRSAPRQFGGEKRRLAGNPSAVGRRRPEDRDQGRGGRMTVFRGSSWVGVRTTGDRTGTCPGAMNGCRNGKDTRKAPSRVEFATTSQSSSTFNPQPPYS